MALRWCCCGAASSGDPMNWTLDGSTLGNAGVPLVDVERDSLPLSAFPSVACFL